MVKIGKLELKNQVFSAPMAGVTDRSFRILARDAGCGLVYTEMINDQALCHNLRVFPGNFENGPLAVQIFGHDPGSMARAACLAASRGADIVDINMGCPAPRVTKNGDGVALMRDPNRALQVATAVVQAAAVPVTVKMRMGWDDHSINAVELAARLESVGVQAVTVHGRTGRAFYSGRADWRIIREVKEALTIPVIGNGDVVSPQDARRLLDETSCDAVMIGRGAMGNPWLLAGTACYLDTGRLLDPPSVQEIMSVIRRHLALKMEDKGERTAVVEMRKHSAWYARGQKGAARFRECIGRVSTARDFLQLWEDFLALAP